MLTVETGVNVDSKSTNERGPSTGRQLRPLPSVLNRIIVLFCTRGKVILASKIEVSWAMGDRIFHTRFLLGD